MRGINMQKRIRTALLLIALLLYACPSRAADFTAQVISVHDGDSLTVNHADRKIKIRLQGIDCPELGQAFGKKAKEAAVRLVKGKTVAVKPVGKDKYGRTLANVVLKDSRSLNQELVRLGYAWWLRKYSKDQTLGKLETKARKGRLGLWAQEKPVPPWEWRKQQRKKGKQPALDTKAIPNGVEIIALLPNPKGPDKGHEQVVIANRNKAAVDLDKWKFQDRAGNVFLLLVKVPGHGRLLVTMTEPTMPLNNDGDEVLLIDPEGVVRSRVAYSKDEVRSGKWVVFGQPHQRRESQDSGW